MKRHRSATSATLVAALLVLSAVAPFIAFTGTAAAAPPGYVTVPNDNVHEKIPDKLNARLSINDSTLLEKSRGKILAKEHAETLGATWRVINRRSGKFVNQNAANAIIKGSGNVPLDIVLVLSDDVAHEGRRVAVDADVLKQAFGRRPYMAHGTHESGDTWTSPITYTDGYASWKVPKFSSNTVDFTGTVQVDGNMSDGSSVSYNISDLDSTTDPNVTFTGVANTAWDNVSATALKSGDSFSLAVAGNAPPVGPSANEKPVVTFTGRDYSYNPVDDDSDGTIDYDYGLVGDAGGDHPENASVEVEPNSNITATKLAPHIGEVQGSDYGAVVDIYIDEGGADGTWKEGTLVKNDWNPSWSSGRQEIQLDSNYSLTGGQTYEIEFVTGSTDGDTTRDSLDISTSNAGSVRFVESFVNTNKYSDWGDLRVIDEGNKTTDPSVDVNGDGTADASYSGSIEPGESVTRELSNLTASTDSATVSLNGGSVDIAVKFEERTVSTDPSVEVNDGNWLNYTGTLNDGETASVTGNSSWLQTGENTLNVSMPALSADAPLMQVAVNYTHEATDKISVDYDAEQWTRRYNVTKKYASGRTSSTYTIPFETTVMQVRSLEYSINGSAFSSVSKSNYALENSTITVDMDAISGGKIQTGEKITVRTNGSVVEVTNGNIVVTDPSLPGEKLDSKVKVTNDKSGDLIFSLGGTKYSDRSHYVYDASWTSEPSEYMTITASGTKDLVIPGTAYGSTFRVSTIPFRVQPESDDVVIEVVNASTTAPVVAVSPGASSGDNVAFTFINAKDDTKYILYSKTHDVVRDSGTANSPLTLEDDDSEETLIFKQDDDSSSGGGGGGGGGGDGGGVPPVPASSSSGGGIPLSDVLPRLGILAAVTIGLAAAYRFSQTADGDVAETSSVSDNASLPKKAGALVKKSAVGGIAGVGKVVEVAVKALVFVSKSVRPLARFIWGGLKTLFATRMGRYIGFAVILFVVLNSRALQLTQQTQVLLVVAAILVGTYIALKRAGAFSMPLYALIAGILTVLGLNAMGSDFITVLVSSPAFSIVVIVSAIIIWRLISSWRRGNTTILRVAAERVRRRGNN